MGRAKRHNHPTLLGLMTGALFCSPQIAQAGPFIGQFELKTLDAGAGEYEFQSQNAWAWDQPARRVQHDTEELLFDENSVFKERYALELEFGLSERYKMRAGFEAERERLDEPSSRINGNEFGALRIEEFGIELITIIVPRAAQGFALGAVVELEGPLDQEEANHLSVGAILEYRRGEWFAAAVPLLVHAFGGEGEAGEPRDNKWDFAYAAQLMRELNEHWSLSIEAYGTIERLGSSGHRSNAAQHFGDANQHRAGLVAYYARPLGNVARDGDSRRELTIGLGLLEGLTRHTADQTLKLSIELDF